MVRYIGICLDKKQAIILTFTDLSADPSVAKIDSEVERHVKPREGMQTSSPYSVRHSNQQRSLENRNKELLTHYFKAIQKHVGPSDHVLVTGKGIARKQLAKFLEEQLPALKLVVQGTEQTGLPEVVAKARAYFQKASQKDKLGL